MHYQTKMLTKNEIEEAAQLIRRGECVAFPTETVYGLGAHALDKEAVVKIYAAKGRPADNPLIVHLYNIAQLSQVALRWPREAELLMEKFWPGPLTLVLERKSEVPEIISAGLHTVAVRIPAHPLALELLKKAGVPVAAPSANVSGRPSPTRASHVLEDLDGKIAAIIDGGETGWGVESTVLDCTIAPFRLLRPGAVTLEQLRQHVDVVMTEPAAQQGLPLSPGIKYRHYRPKARVILFTGKDVQRTIACQLTESNEQKLKTVVLAYSENIASYENADTLDLGSRGDLQQAASRIYHLLREVDHRGYQLVLVEGVDESGLGMTIMNRLRAAATEIVST